MKKMICILLIFTLTLFSLGAFAQTPIPFHDVADDHWAFDAISYFYTAEVINGMDETTYAPEAYVTREQLAKLLSVIFGKDTTASAQTFSDVPKDRWSYTYIESVKEYLTGYFPVGGTPFFNPGGRATREDIAYALVRIGGYQTGNSAALDAFSDAGDISPKLASYVAAAVENGLMQGYDGYLRPQDGISRAETAMLLFRAIKQPIPVCPEDTEAPSASPEDDKKAEEKSEETEKQDDTLLLLTDIRQISGYKDGEVCGEISVCFSPENNADFVAELKCRNGAFDYVNCYIQMTKCISAASNTLEGYFTVTLNGKPRHENLKGTVLLSDGILTLHTEDYDYNLIAHTDTYTASEETQGLHDLVFAVKSINNSEADGTLYLTYDTEKTNPKVTGSTRFGETDYRIETKEITQYTEDTVSGCFTIYRGDSPIAQNMEGTFHSLTAGIGGFSYFESQDGSVRAQLLITEIIE